MKCAKCGGTQITTGFKALSARVLDWYHKCLDCGEVISLGIRLDPRPEDYTSDARRQELKNRIITLTKGA